MNHFGRSFFTVYTFNVIFVSAIEVFSRPNVMTYLCFKTWYFSVSFFYRNILRILKNIVDKAVRGEMIITKAQIHTDMHTCIYEGLPQSSRLQINSQDIESPGVITRGCLSNMPSFRNSMKFHGFKSNFLNTHPCVWLIG